MSDQTAVALYRCNQCWHKKPREDFGTGTHECLRCQKLRREGHRAGRSPDLDLRGPLRVKWVPSSKVKKLGPIPTSTTSGFTCPDACALKGNGCYAEFGYGGSHWKLLSRGDDAGLSWRNFLKQVQALPDGQLWRHNLAGDLPGVGNRIASARLRELVCANRGRRGFTFTHKPLTAANAAAIRDANRDGFTVNLSADGPAHADALANRWIAPVAAVVAHDAPERLKTPRGRDIYVCPAQRAAESNCANCGWCQRTDRDWIVGFRAHGQMKKRISLEVVR